MVIHIYVCTHTVVKRRNGRGGTVNTGCSGSRQPTCRRKTAISLFTEKKAKNKQIPVQQCMYELDTGKPIWLLQTTRLLGVRAVTAKSRILSRCKGGRIRIQIKLTMSKPILKKLSLPQWSRNWCGRPLHTWLCHQYLALWKNATQTMLCWRLCVYNSSHTKCKKHANSFNAQYCGQCMHSLSVWSSLYDFRTTINNSQKTW